MENVKHIIEAAGGPVEMAKVLGVKLRVIAHHAQRNILPASWFDALEKMSERELPRNLFSFK
jgi:hypothetical protein